MRGFLRLLGAFVLLGGAGLVLGLALGFATRRWWAVVVLVVLGAIAASFGVGAADDPSCEDDCPDVLVALAVLTNLAGWAVGLIVGTLLGRRRRPI